MSPIAAAMNSSGVAARDIRKPGPHRGGPSRPTGRACRGGRGRGRRSPRAVEQVRRDLRRAREKWSGVCPSPPRAWTSVGVASTSRFSSATFPRCASAAWASARAAGDEVLGRLAAGDVELAPEPAGHQPLLASGSAAASSSTSSVARSLRPAARPGGRARRSRRGCRSAGIAGPGRCRGASAARRRRRGSRALNSRSGSGVFESVFIAVIVVTPSAVVRRRRTLVDAGHPLLAAARRAAAS